MHLAGLAPTQNVRVHEIVVPCAGGASTVRIDNNSNNNNNGDSRASNR